MTGAGEFPVDDREARMLWSCVIEPAEAPAIVLVERMGARDAWQWLIEQGERLSGGGAHEIPGRLRKCVARWHDRAKALEIAKLWQSVDTMAAEVIVPDDPQWPARLDDLREERPLCLWVRGSADLDTVLTMSVSVVGARAATNYGTGQAAKLASDLAAYGYGVNSGGAFGIDAAAHRGALAAGGRTVTFLAGGVDQFYPRAHQGLLEQVVNTGGAVISEMGPGAQPLRSRFLKRNRLIAAAGEVTVIVEAGLRSGAMSTARQAGEVLRPVAAFPGPVTSRVSAGCHELLRAGVAVCVTGVDDVLELVRSHTDTDTDPEGDDLFAQMRPAAAELPDWLAHAVQVLGNVLGRDRRTIDEIVVRSGLAANTVMAALGELESRGEAQWSAGGWSRNSKVS